MMIGRPAAFLLVAALCLAIAAGCAWALIAGVPASGYNRLLIGGALVSGAIGMILTVRCMRWRPPQELAAADDPNAIVHLAVRRFEVRSVAIAFLMMAAGFGFMVFDESSDFRLHVAGWLGMLCAAAASVMIFVTKRPVSLRLSPEGLDVSAFGVGVIPWRDIRSARSIWAFGRVPMVALDLNNEEEYKVRRGGPRSRFLERLLLSSSFTFASPAMEVSCDMLVKAIETRLTAFGRGSQPT